MHIEMFETLSSTSVRNFNVAKMLVQFVTGGSRDGVEGRSPPPPKSVLDPPMQFVHDPRLAC